MFSIAAVSLPSYFPVYIYIWWLLPSCVSVLRFLLLGAFVCRIIVHAYCISCQLLSVGFFVFCFVFKSWIYMWVSFMSSFCRYSWANSRWWAARWLGYQSQTPAPYNSHTMNNLHSLIDNRKRNSTGFIWPLDHANLSVWAGVDPLVTTNFKWSGLGSKSKLCDWLKIHRKQGLSSTCRSLPSAFHGFRVENASAWTSQPLLCCWRTLDSERCRTKIEKSIGTACILYVPKDKHGILNNKDARHDRSTRKMRSLHSAGAMQHILSNNDTADWLIVRRVSKR